MAFIAQSLSIVFPVKLSIISVISDFFNSHKSHKVYIHIYIT